MLTQASWRAPVSPAAVAAPGLATAVVPPRTPAIRAPVVSPPGDDRDANEPNPFQKKGHENWSFQPPLKTILKTPLKMFLTKFPQQILKTASKNTKQNAREWWRP